MGGGRGEGGGELFRPRWNLLLLFQDHVSATRPKAAAAAAAAAAAVEGIAKKGEPRSPTHPHRICSLLHFLDTVKFVFIARTSL